MHSQFNWVPLFNKAKCSRAKKKKKKISDQDSDWFIRALTTAFPYVQNAVEPPPRFLGRWTGTFIINAFVVAWVLVVGFGFGGWASMTNFVRQIDTFGLFTKCYQCPSPPPLAPGASLPFPGGLSNITMPFNGMLPPAPAPSPAHLHHHSHGL